MGDPLSGREIGEVRLEGKLGAGGMASVYLGRDLARGGAPCAIKLLSVASPEGFRSRFEREARIGEALDDEALVRVHRSGLSGDYHFAVMDLVEGEDLAHVLAREGPLHWTQAAAVGRDVARALEALHRRGVVHRDLKPANVLLDARGALRLADFGLARWRAAPADLPTEAALTATGDAFGTPIYMAPEQFADAKSVTAAADLYALGVILFEALTGRPPFSASRPHVLARLHREVPPPSLTAQAADAPEALRELVEELLEKEPGARPAAAAEVSDRLTAVLAGKAPDPLPLRVAGAGSAAAWRAQPTAPPPGATAGPGATATTLPPRRRSRWPALVAMTGAAVALATVGWSLPGVRVHLASPEERARYGAIQEALEQVREDSRGFRDALATYQRDFGEQGLLRREVAALARRPVRLRANVFLVACDGAELLQVRGGAYTIGRGEPGKEPAEGLSPRRTVSVPGFLIDRAEVSNRRYERFLAEWRAAGAVHRCGRTDLDHQPAADLRTRSPDPDAPVVGVTPWDALEYARFYGRRLPTEDEWEVAASWDPQSDRARAYPWGEQQPSIDSPYLANLALAEFGRVTPEGDFLVTCAPTGTFELDRSVYGLLDVAGNAAEWCAGDMPLPGRQPVRGGSIETREPHGALLAWRRLYDPAAAPPPATGFRTVLPYEPR